jgi:integrase
VDEGTANHLVEHHDWCEKTAAALGGVLRDDAFVLADLAADRTGGRPWRPDRLSKAFRRLADDVEVDVWLHLIRHWNASMQLDAGRSLPDVAARLGHSSPQVTARVYAHVLDSPDAGAVAAVTKALGRGS